MSRSACPNYFNHVSSGRIPKRSATLISTWVPAATVRSSSSVIASRIRLTCPTPDADRLLISSFPLFERVHMTTLLSSDEFFRSKSPLSNNRSTIPVAVARLTPKLEARALILLGPSSNRIRSILNWGMVTSALSHSRGKTGRNGTLVKLIMLSINCSVSTSGPKLQLPVQQRSRLELRVLCLSPILCIKQIIPIRPRFCNGILEIGDGSRGPQWDNAQRISSRCNAHSRPRQVRHATLRYRLPGPRGCV